MKANQFNAVRNLVTSLNTLRSDFSEHEITMDFRSTGEPRDYVIEINCPFQSNTIAIAHILEEFSTVTVSMTNRQLTVW